MTEQQVFKSNRIDLCICMNMCAGICIYNVNKIHDLVQV